MSPSVPLKALSWRFDSVAGWRAGVGDGASAVGEGRPARSLIRLVVGSSPEHPASQPTLGPPPPRPALPGLPSPDSIPHYVVFTLTLSLVQMQPGARAMKRRATLIIAAQTLTPLHYCYKSRVSVYVPGVATQLPTATRRLHPRKSSTSTNCLDR